MSARHTFEGSYLGDAARIADGTRLECGICWYVYDPAQGDPVWQITAGTPFRRLPEHWRCPQCDAEQHHFMALAGAEPTPAADPVDRMLAAYRAADQRMRGLPVHHAGLSVEAIGFRPWNGALVGVVVTPWCMNLVRLGAEAEGLAEGSEREHELPQGRFTFVVGKLANEVTVEQCSLFSPMAEFADQAAAVAVAEEVMAMVLAPRTASRRAIFGGVGHGG